jgi:hypothetical protein
MIEHKYLCLAAKRPPVGGLFHSDFVRVALPLLAVIEYGALYRANDLRCLSRKPPFPRNKWQTGRESLSPETAWWVTSLSPTISTKQSSDTAAAGEARREAVFAAIPLDFI